MIGPTHLLFIEPVSSAVALPPMLDRYTRRMTAALRAATLGTQYRGWHTCAFGAESHAAERMTSDDARMTLEAATSS